MGEVYRHLGLDDRVQIEKYVEQGCSFAWIARVLGVHRCTVCREVKRGWYRPGSDQANFRRPSWRFLRTRRARSGFYSAVTAHSKALTRQARSHQPYVMNHDLLIDYVTTKLREG
ncbi:MAG: helix-turn-helix domain-containing protein [Actinomycetaceae bacterium]|nr:helix-turn-helix domain-containing protein [Actinomycetaceae bacterium]MDY6083315.1 helix-turn-helix domain-containing protein [Actinomycetaceae bacterium]